MAVYLITGGGGFIGSNLARHGVETGHEVRVIDDFSTGHRANIDSIQDRITLFDGSILDEDVLGEAMKGVDYVLHQAAVPSVPRSVENPLHSNEVNVTGTLKVFLAARDAGVKRVVFASSSSVYGLAEVMPLKESLPRGPISPYGVTKATDELYGANFTDLYGLDVVALRYFNVFGPHQDPHSTYAAVIPIFIRQMLAGQSPTVHGDGLQARDFSYIDNVVAANFKACAATGSLSGVYNIACGVSTTLLDLVGHINTILGTTIEPVFEAGRAGDIRYSHADISKAREGFGYSPVMGIEAGLERTVSWIREH